MQIDKKEMSEREICSKYITPAILDAGWDLQTQIREEVNLTKGQFLVRGGGQARSFGLRRDLRVRIHLHTFLPVL